MIGRRANPFLRCRPWTAYHMSMWRYVNTFMVLPQVSGAILLTPLAAGPYRSSLRAVRA